MGSLIHFEMGKNGELTLLIHPDLWQVIQAKASAPTPENPENTGNPENAGDAGDAGDSAPSFTRISLTGIVGQNITVFASVPINQEPCQDG